MLVAIPEVLQLRIRGLSEEGASALEQQVERSGAELLESGPTHRPLQELYKAREPRGGGSGPR